MNLFPRKVNFFLWSSVLLGSICCVVFLGFSITSAEDEVTIPEENVSPAVLNSEDPAPPVEDTPIPTGVEPTVESLDSSDTAILPEEPLPLDAAVVPVPDTTEPSVVPSEIGPIPPELDIAVLPPPLATTTSTSTPYTDAEIAGAQFVAMSELPVFVFSYGSSTEEGFFSSVASTISETVTQVSDVVQNVVDMVSGAAQAVVDFVSPTVETLFSLTIDMAPDATNEDAQSAIVNEAPQTLSETTEVVEDAPAIVETQSDDDVMVPQDSAGDAPEKALDVPITDPVQVEEVVGHAESGAREEHEVPTEPEIGEPEASTSTATTSVATPLQASSTSYVDGVLVGHTVAPIDELTFSVTLDQLVDPGPHMLRFQTDTEDGMQFYERLFFVGGFVRRIQPLDQGKTLYYIETKEGGHEVWLKEHALGSAIGFLILADDATMLLDSPFEYVEGKVIWVSVEGGAFVGFDTNARTLFSQTREVRGDTRLPLEQETYDVSLLPDDISFVIEPDPIEKK